MNWLKRTESNSIDDVIIDYYFGTYNGAVVISIRRKANSYSFGTFATQPGSGYINVWKDGELYAFHQAYENDFLTNQEVIEIALRFHEQFPGQPIVYFPY